MTKYKTFGKCTLCRENEAVYGGMKVCEECHAVHHNAMKKVHEAHKELAKIKMLLNFNVKTYEEVGLG